MKYLPHFLIIIIIIILLKLKMITIKITIKIMNPKAIFKCGSYFVFIL